MLTIGQLARIFEISTKTLRHYDAIGLFVPARTGSDNGYRYYQPEQIEQLSRILALRRLDVPLEAIDRLKRDGALDDPQRLRHFLQRHQHTLREEISARQRLLAELDRTLATLAHWRIRNMHARIVERPAFSVVGMEYFGSAPGDTIGQLWERFIPREHEIAGKHDPEVSYGICAQQPNGEFHYVAGFEVQEGWPVPEGMVRFQVPAQKYAVFTHKGTAPQIAESFQAIYSHLLAERGLEPKAGSTSNTTTSVSADRWIRTRKSTCISPSTESALAGRHLGWQAHALQQRGALVVVAFARRHQRQQAGRRAHRHAEGYHSRAARHQRPGMDPGVGLGEGAAHVQRRAQREDPQALAVRVTSRSSFSLAKFTVPSTLTSAFSVSKTNSRLVIRPFCRPKSAAAQLIFTSSSPNSLVTR